MKFIREYNSFQVSEINIDDIRDCFIGVKDVSTTNTNILSVKKNNENIVVTVYLDNNVSGSEDIKKSEYGGKYRYVINGVEIAEEVSEALYKCIECFDLKIKIAFVKWVNAGEWAFGHEDRDINLGPGLLSKAFNSEGLIDVSIKGLTKGQFSTDLLSDFILDKGDRLRYVSIEFTL